MTGDHVWNFWVQGFKDTDCAIDWHISSKALDASRLQWNQKHNECVSFHPNTGAFGARLQRYQWFHGHISSKVPSGYTSWALSISASKQCGHRFQWQQFATNTLLVCKHWCHSWLRFELLTERLRRHQWCHYDRHNQLQSTGCIGCSSSKN